MERGGSLASIHSEEEQNFLLDLMDGHFHIGVHDMNGDGEWGWMDYSDLDFESWKRNEPLEDDKK